MRLSLKKQILIFIIGSLLNILLFCITRYTGLYNVMPLWCDYTGTLYIAGFCGPIAAALSLTVHTVIITILLGKAAILSALPIIFIIVIIFLFLQSGGNKNIHKSISMAFCSCICSFFVNTIIILICNGPEGKYAFYYKYFSFFIQNGNKFTASVLTSAMFTFTELLLCFIILSAASILTPRREENLIFKK